MKPAKLQRVSSWYFYRARDGRQIKKNCGSQNSPKKAWIWYGECSFYHSQWQMILSCVWLFFPFLFSLFFENATSSWRTPCYVVVHTSQSEYGVPLVSLTEAQVCEIETQRKKTARETAKRWQRDNMITSWFTWLEWMFATCQSFSFVQYFARPFRPPHPSSPIVWTWIGWCKSKYAKRDSCISFGKETAKKIFVYVTRKSDLRKRGNCSLS